MGVHLYLSVADDSIESPELSRDFLEHIFWEWSLKLKDFLTPEEAFLAKPNEYGEIVFGKKREPTTLEKAKAPFILNKALNGKITVEEINALRDKFMDRSEKIEDRERDSEKLKEVLMKIEQYLEQNPLDEIAISQFSEDFSKCYSFLDQAIQAKKKVLWEYD